MNFRTSRQFGDKIMKDGDLVIVYERHDTLDHIYLKKGAIFKNKYGTFPHDDIIGKRFGSKIMSNCASNQHGWIYILQPTPELWSSALNTRTQIVNELDSSVITLNLDLYAGCTVIESGTGSGCMSLVLARAVHPNGHVYTYEYNSIRAEKAREEFDKLGVGDLITVSCGDVCGKVDPAGGGGFKGVPPHTADAVFLDLPEPWLALDHAFLALKPNGNICCYSPCIEQVMKTCEKLRELGFHSIRMIEVRQRPFDGRVASIDTLDVGLSKEEDIANNIGAREEISPDHGSGSCSTAPISSRVVQSGSSNQNGSNVGNRDIEDRIEKRKFTDGADEQNKKQARLDPNESTLEATLQQDGKDEPVAMHRRILNRPKSAVNGVYSMAVARPVSSMKGHTAFLTFANYCRQ